MCFVQKNSKNSMKTIFFKFQRFFRGFEFVLVQMLLIQTLFSVQFYIRREVILSSLRRYDYFVCRVNRFRVMVEFVRETNKFQIL